MPTICVIQIIIYDLNKNNINNNYDYDHRSYQENVRDYKAFLMIGLGSNGRGRNQKNAQMVTDTRLWVIRWLFL